MLGLLLITALWIVPPAQPVQALAALPPIAQGDVDEEIANHIAEIRERAPDIVDEFSSDDSSWETFYDGETSIFYRNRRLNFAIDVEDTIIWTAGDHSPRSFYLELDTIHRDGSLDNQLGIVFRYQDRDNFYLFSISSDGYYSLFAQIEDEWGDIVKWNVSDVIETGDGSRNTLGLLVEGNTYTLLINDYLIATVTDDALTEGAIGMAAGSFSEAPVEVAFDNYRLWVLEETPQPTRPIRLPTRPAATPAATLETTAEPTAEATPSPTEEATGVLTLDAIVAQPPTYFEAFDIEPEGWDPHKTNGITHTVLDGALQIDISLPNALGWSALPVAPLNYYVEVDAALVGDIDSAEYGILFKYQNPQNFYLFAVGNNGRYSLWHFADNNWQVLNDWADSPALNTGPDQTNRLGLLVQDNVSYTLVANDVLLAEIASSPDDGRSLALAAGSFGQPDLAIRFDNLSVWDLDELGLAVQPTAEPTPESTAEPTAEPTPAPLPDTDTEAARIADILATEPTLSDDFRRDNGQWSIPESTAGAYYYERRALNIVVDELDYILWSKRLDAEGVAVDYTDFYVEVDATFRITDTLGGMGFVFRLIDSDNFYMFTVSQNGYVNLYKKVAGEFTKLSPWREDPAIATDNFAVNRVGVLMEGSVIVGTVNGAVVLIAEDSDIAAGSIALSAQTYDETPVLVAFDNLQLWELAGGQ
jgi:hypothetical protein